VQLLLPLLSFPDIRAELGRSVESPKHVHYRCEDASALRGELLRMHSDAFVQARPLETLVCSLYARSRRFRSLTNSSVLLVPRMIPSWHLSVIFKATARTETSSCRLAIVIPCKEAWDHVSLPNPYVDPRCGSWECTVLDISTRNVLCRATSVDPLCEADRPNGNHHHLDVMWKPIDG
jgi:hypothetical protein